MKKKLVKHLFTLLLAVTIVLPAGLFAFSQPAKAINLWGDSFAGSDSVGFDAFKAIGMGSRDPRAIAASVINILLGLLGVLAIILIIYGGFMWMTAAGNDDKVAQAKKILGAGIVGLLIILAAYAVSIYIIRTFLKGTGADITGDQNKYNLDTNVD